MRFSNFGLVAAFLAVSASGQFLPDIRISPTRIAVGSGDTTITVFGTNFTPGYQVCWNGAPRNTQFVTSGMLKASIGRSDLMQPGLIEISLYDSDASAPASNIAPFLVYLPLRTVDLVYDSVHTRIYAALPQKDPNGPAIAVIDPVRGIVERYIPTPSEPTTLAVSPNAQHLYIGMKDRVRRTDLSGAGIDQDLMVARLAPDSPTSPVNSILPLSGDGTSYVVALGAGALGLAGGTFVVDGVRPRPNHFNGSPCLVGAVGDIIYGDPAFSLKLDTAGLSEIQNDVSVNLANGPFCPVLANGLLYGSNGDIVDLNVSALVGRFGAWGMVDAAPERSKVYFFGFAGMPTSIVNHGSPSLMIFDMASHGLIQAVALPIDLLSYGGRLIHWGTDGVAFGDYSAYNNLVSDGLYLVRVPATN